MLDQNTDRMWYVIGAVLIGAAILLLLNGTAPDLFAQVAGTYEEKTEEATASADEIGDNLQVKYAEFGDEISTIRTWDPVENFHAYKGSDVQTSLVDSAPEMTGEKATRVVGTGGSMALKSHTTLYKNSQQEYDYNYVYDVEIKNLNDESLFVSNNKGVMKEIAPHTYETVRMAGRKSGAHLQLQLLADTADGTVDAMIGQLTFGAIDESEE